MSLRSPSEVSIEASPEPSVDPENFDETSSQLAHHGEEQDNWVITTPAQILDLYKQPRKKAVKKGTKAKGKAPAQPSSSSQHVNPSRPPPKSARLANIQRRKEKQREQQQLQQQLQQRLAQNLAQDQDASTSAGVPIEVIASVEDEHDEDDEEENDDELEIISASKPRKRRKRVSTPEGSELVTIVPSMMSMFDLSARTRRNGLKSERESKMRKIDWTAVKQRRKEDEVRKAYERGVPKNYLDAENEPEFGEEATDADMDAALNRVLAQNATKKTAQGVRIRVVNGEHVVDEQTQRVDRHAHANEDLEALEEIEEDDLTRQFNSQTYIHMRRRDPKERIRTNDKWSMESTDKFYRALAQFGTDFYIISQMFPGRTRRQIKAKYIREERADPERVQHTLSASIEGEGNSRKWDLEVFREHAGMALSDFKDPRAIEAELEARRKEREEQIEEQRLETEETKRQRRLAGELSEGNEDEEGNTQAGATSKKKNAPAITRDLLDEELEEIEEGSDLEDEDED
ncbi:hypothetical protein BT63DRAFT_427660 [Microthyrium microscopicum]|uniref:Myb-like domain-containing protein n=1 Tax=Microthyrium microscopicum TaxID=703497 RepID=A0A6A6U406_9PEZI|nr:hypothetical protein BT63DRAFT_427660 [Microthyrium microscopicum]